MELDVFLCLGLLQDLVWHRLPGDQKNPLPLLPGTQVDQLLGDLASSSGYLTEFQLVFQHAYSPPPLGLGLRNLRLLSFIHISSYHHNGFGNHRPMMVVLQLEGTWVSKSLLGGLPPLLLHQPFLATTSLALHSSFVKTLKIVIAFCYQSCQLLLIKSSCSRRCLTKLVKLMLQ